MNSDRFYIVKSRDKNDGTMPSASFLSVVIVIFLERSNILSKRKLFFILCDLFIEVEKVSGKRRVQKR